MSDCWVERGTAPGSLHAAAAHGEPSRVRATADARPADRTPDGRAARASREMSENARTAEVRPTSKGLVHWLLLQKRASSPEVEFGAEIDR